MGFDLLRMSFPTVTANSSPMSVLPNWVEVLGKNWTKYRRSWTGMHTVAVHACKLTIIQPWFF